MVSSYRRSQRSLLPSGSKQSTAPLQRPWIFTNRQDIYPKKLESSLTSLMKTYQSLWRPWDWNCRVCMHLLLTAWTSISQIHVIHLSSTLFTIDEFTRMQYTLSACYTANCLLSNHEKPTIQQSFVSFIYPDWQNLCSVHVQGQAVRYHRCAHLPASLFICQRGTHVVTSIREGKEEQTWYARAHICCPLVMSCNKECRLA
jgi:hypothetical protein